jgi:hypothetical protein
MTLPGCRAPIQTRGLATGRGRRRFSELLKSSAWAATSAMAHAKATQNMAPRTTFRGEGLFSRSPPPLLNAIGTIPHPDPPVPFPGGHLGKSWLEPVMRLNKQACKVCRPPHRIFSVRPNRLVRNSP